MRGARMIGLAGVALLAAGGWHLLRSSSEHGVAADGAGLSPRLSVEGARAAAVTKAEAAARAEAGPPPAPTPAADLAKAHELDELVRSGTPDSVKALVAESADQRLGHRAAAALGAVHNPDAAAQLAAIATGNDSALVRANAVQALAASGSHAQAPALIKLLSDRSQPLRVRLEAALTLGRLRDDTAVPAMARLLGNQEPEDGSLRLATEQALAQIGTPAARKALAQVRAASPGEQRLLSALNVR